MLTRLALFEGYFPQVNQTVCGKWLVSLGNIYENVFWLLQISSLDVKVQLLIHTRYLVLNKQWCYSDKTVIYLVTPIIYVCAIKAVGAKVWGPIYVCT